jgi:hypothetical protein
MVDAALNRLTRLKVAKGRKGVATNKTLLLLAILDLFEAGWLVRMAWFTRMPS